MVKCSNLYWGPLFIQIHCINVCVICLHIYYYIRLMAFFSTTIWISRHQKGKPFWILMKQEVVGWQWHQLDHVQIICTSLQKDNNASMINWLELTVPQCEHWCTCNPCYAKFSHGLAQTSATATLWWHITYAYLKQGCSDTQFLHKLTVTFLHICHKCPLRSRNKVYSLNHDK